MCEIATDGHVCWWVVVSLTMIPASLLVFARILLAEDEHERTLRRSHPFARITPGPVLLWGTLRAESGVPWLEDPRTGARVRVDSAVWPLPPPGTRVTVQGVAIAREPDPRAGGYREAKAVWRLRADEICSVEQKPLLPPPFAITPLRRVVAWRRLAWGMLGVGIVFGVVWPTWLNWCNCVWPSL